MTTQAEPLTRERITGLPAGRELDALVCERVLGQKVYRHTGPVYAKGRIWLDPGEPYTVNEHSQSCEVPYYSADIAAAWAVEEELFRANRGEDYGYALMELIGRRTGHMDAIYERTATVMDIAHTPPDVRCRAALLTTLPPESASWPRG